MARVDEVMREQKFGNSRFDPLNKRVDCLDRFLIGLDFLTE